MHWNEKLKPSYMGSTKIPNLVPRGENPGNEVAKFPETWQSHLKLCTQRKGKQSVGPAEEQAVNIPNVFCKSSMLGLC